MTEERWLPVAGFEGYYEVSDLGRVRSLDRPGVTKNGRRCLYRGRILAQGTAGAGYAAVGLHRSGIAVTRYVHSLVLESFVGPRPVGYTHTRHLNGNPRDNCLPNLVYGTPTENAADKVLHGTVRTRLEVATHCARNHPFDDENTVLDSQGMRQCRTCRRDRDREAKRESRRQGLTADDPKHGTVSGYVNHCCKCEPCLEVGREWRRNNRRVNAVPVIA